MKNKSKSHLLQLIKDLKLIEGGSVSVQKFYTEKGMCSGYIIHPEGGRILTLKIKKIMPEEKNHQFNAKIETII